MSSDRHCHNVDDTKLYVYIPNYRIAKMNIGKSTKICIAKNERNTAWLAEKLGVTSARVSAIMNATHHNTLTITKLAEAFGLSVSEFIALGED